MVGGIALILFAILLRFFGLIILPLILGIVGLLMALFGGSKQTEPDPWEDEAEISTESPSTPRLTAKPSNTNTMQRLTNTFDLI